MWQGERIHAHLDYGCARGAVTDTPRPPGRVAVMHLCRCGVSQEIHARSGAPGTMGMSASVSYTSIGLDTERRVLACQQVYWSPHTCAPSDGRTAYGVPVDAMPPHILHHCLPEPSTVWTYSGLCFREIVCFRVNDFRGVKNGCHSALLVVCYDTKGRGLPLAEQSARRYWRGVEGGTVLNVVFTISTGKYTSSVCKRKTNCFHH